MDEKRTMSERERFCAGGFGALVPILISLIAADYAAFAVSVPFATLIGYFLKAVGLFVLGGLVTKYLYASEQDRARLFVAGISAPALLLTYANGVKPAPPHLLKTSAPGVFLLSTVHAESNSLKSFGPPEESFSQQVVRGISGTAPTRIYFVIAGSFSTEEAAVKQTELIRQRFPKAQIYRPSGGNKYYSVVLVSCLK